MENTRSKPPRCVCVCVCVCVHVQASEYSIVNIVAESLGAAGQGGLRMDTGCQSLLSVHHGNTFIILQPQLHYNNIGLLKCSEMSDSLTHSRLKASICLWMPELRQKSSTSVMYLSAF